MVLAEGRVDQRVDEVAADCPHVHRLAVLGEEVVQTAPADDGLLWVWIEAGGGKRRQRRETAMNGRGGGGGGSDKGSTK